MKLRGAIFGISVLALLVSAAPETQAARSRSSGRGAGGEARLRLTGGYGRVEYSQAGPATEITNGSTGQRYGGMAQFEAWGNSGVGLLFSGSGWETGFASTSGRQKIYLLGAGVELGWKLAGGNNPMNGETMIFAGPSFDYWPDVRTYPGLIITDTVNVRTLGARAGIRWRVPLSHEMTAEFGGSYDAPFRLLGARGISLDRTQSRRVMAQAFLDYRVADGVGTFVGGTYQLNRMGYASDLTPGQPQLVTLNVSAGLLGFLFWF